MTCLLSRAREWIQTVQLEPTTLIRYVYSLGSLARAGVDQLEQVDRPTIKRFMVSKLQEGVTPSTVNRDLAALCSFLSWLYDLGEFALPTLLDLRTLYIRTAPPPPPDFLTHEEFLRLREAARSVHPILDLAVATAVHTGLRFQELRTLWTDDFVLDVPLPYVHVQRTRGRKIKTKRGRTPPIARAFADELLARGFTESVRAVFPPLKKDWRGGDYMATSTLQRWLWPAEERAGLKCNWITFRHTYASWLIQNNVSITKVAHYLGNGVGICFSHYGALIPGGDAEVEKGFAALRSGS